MKYTLAIFFCAFSVTAIHAQARMPAGETPVFPPMPSATKDAVQQPAMREGVIQGPTPCQNCKDNRYRENHLYRWAITDWDQSPGHQYDTDRLTWWFIPRPRALILAICP